MVFLHRHKRPLRPWERRAFHRTITVVICSLLSKTQAFSLDTVHQVAGKRNQPATLCWSTVASTAVVDQQSLTDASGAVGLYVHIPYCRRRCRYCDFAIVPIGPSASTETCDHELREDKATTGFLKMDSIYRATILKEIGIITKTVSGESMIPLRSIYFGGGTPSLAPIETLDAILSAVRDGPFCLDPNAEITIEMDPGTFSLSKLKTIKKLGFNRVSLGVQSFDDTILESIGRCHRREDIFESISLLHQVYGDNVNYSIDLISGLPGVSLAKWVETLEMATSLSPSHLSIYDLQVESGTVFGKWYNGQDGSQSRGRTQGSVPVDVPPLPSMEECAFCYKYASRYLRARGYDHYEISSYAYKGNESSSSSSVNRSQHNQIYWEYSSQWFAVGLGATSSIAGKRYARPRTMIDYIRWVDEQVIAPRPAFLPNDDEVECSIDLDSLTDIIMTRLRTSDGLDLDWIRDNVPGGQDVVEMIMKGAGMALDLGLAEHVRSERDGGILGSLRLVDPSGFLFSNSIISSIFVELGSEG